MPLLAASQTLWQAAGLVVERFGKAVRTPARDTMLARASTNLGRGTAFAIHEALDQTGALLGPLLMAGMITLSGIWMSFLVLVVPGALALLTLAWLRRSAPHPAAYEAAHPAADTRTATMASVPPPGQFWLYTAFTAVSMAGFATFGVLSYHLEVRHVLPTELIPVSYAVAMAPPPWPPWGPAGYMTASVCADW